MALKAYIWSIPIFHSQFYASYRQLLSPPFPLDENHLEDLVNTKNLLLGAVLQYLEAFLLPQSLQSHWNWLYILYMWFTANWCVFSQ